MGTQEYCASPGGPRWAVTRPSRRPRSEVGMCLQTEPRSLPGVEARGDVTLAEGPARVPGGSPEETGW